MEDRYSLPPDIAAALDRARLQVEALAQTADELQIVLPDAVGSALRDGLREEAAPISRRLAEVKGLSNQMIRRLERLETDLLIERHARVDDLALLVDLITAQWKALNERLDRIEHAIDPQADVVPSCGAAETRRLRRGQEQLEARARGRGSESSSIEPPSACESSRAIASPSPVPPRRPRRTGRKSRSTWSAAIPGPVSSTATWTVPFVCPSSSAIRPPSGVARNAFESRLSTICSTRSPSETITGLAFTSTREVDRAGAGPARRTSRRPARRPAPSRPPPEDA